MRPILVLLALTSGACDAPAFRPAGLPQLAAAPTFERPISAPQLLLPPGEHLIWEVHVHGMTIGRVELEIGDGDVHSRFQTDSLASTVMFVHHELVTTLDRVHARALTSAETVDVGHEPHDVEATFDGSRVVFGGAPQTLPAGNVGQTMHTALGLLRAWARPDAAPGFITIAEDGELFRLDVARPTAAQLQGTDALRIDGRVPAKQPIAFVMWLSATPERKPLRFEISSDAFHVVADLVQ